MTVMIKIWNSSAIVAILLIHICHGMSIPEDMEILDGYNMEAPYIDFAGEQDGFYERSSLLEPLFHRAIRDRRHVRYQVFESPGLHSHFHPGRDYSVTPTRARTRRDVESSTVIGTTTPTEAPESRENMPVAEQQIQNFERMEDQWRRAPHKTSAIHAKTITEANDSNGEESIIINENLKSRAPRVNFITQQSKSHLQPSEDQEGGRDKILRDLHRKPLPQQNHQHALPRAYDSYMAPSQSPMYPQVYNKYDTFHRDMMDRLHPPAPHRYDHYYQRRYDVDYDSYFPRYKFPYFYYYPDKRYDVPMHYRDRNFLYTNEIDTAFPDIPPYHRPFKPSPTPSSIGSTLRNRRIIYFATLPEIVRTSSNMDAYYRYEQSMRNRYDPLYSTRAPQSTSAYKDRRPVNDDRKEDKYVSSRPIKIVREVDTTQDKLSKLRDSQQGKFQEQQQKRWINVMDTNRSLLQG